MMRLLFVTTMLPHTRLHGGEIWSQTIVDSLRRNGADVTVLGYCREGVSPADGEIGAGPHLVESGSTPIRSLMTAVASLGREGFTVRKWRSAAYRSRLSTLLATGKWTAAVVDHAQMAWTLPLLRGLPVFYLAHHAERALYARLAELAGPLLRHLYAREARLIGQAEEQLIARAHRTWCISKADEERLRLLPHRHIVTLTTSSDVEPRSPRPVTPGTQVALLGNWRWQLNRAALRWFLEEVQPRLPADWRIAVGGQVDRTGLPAFSAVHFVGKVDDGAAFLAQAERIAVPSLAAEGANLKLLSAIASGRPVVASAGAIRLIGDVPGDVVSAETAEDFAHALMHPPTLDLRARMRWLGSRRAQLDAMIGEGLAALPA